MTEIINDILQVFSTNSDAIILTVATGAATIMVFAIRYIFNLLSDVTLKTPTILDDKLLQKIKDIFKSKIKDL